MGVVVAWPVVIRIYRDDVDGASWVENPGLGIRPQGAVDTPGTAPKFGHRMGK